MNIVSAKPAVDQFVRINLGEIGNHRSITLTVNTFCNRPTASTCFSFAAAIILAIYPYYKPSIKEMKRITWPSKKEMLSNTLIVIAFIVIVAFLFLGYDAILNQVVKLFKYLGNLMR